MRNAKKLFLISLTFITLVMASACGQTNNPANNTTAAQGQNTSVSEQTTEKIVLTISAAASLKDSLEAVKIAYVATKPNTDIIINFGSSGSLQQQIEQGAQVDLFISAAAKQMDALKAKGLIEEGTRKNLLGNSIVLIAPKGSTTVTSFDSLTSNNVKKIALGEPKSVPVGQYGEEALKSIGLLDKITPKAIYAKDVKEVLTWVETGNADAGIVYKTDALGSDKVNIVTEAPSGSYTPVVYPAAVLKNSKNLSSAKDFINYLYSDAAKPVFEKYGFVFMP